MSIFKGVFGPSQEEIWRPFAEEIDAEFIDNGVWKSKKIIYKHENWTIILDTYSESSGKSSTTYTRMRAPYRNKDGFNFKIYNSGFFSDIGKKFGMQDIEIGYPDFDEKFIIKGNDEDKLKELFESEKIREFIQLQDKIHLEIKEDEGFCGSEIPEGVNLLYFKTIGVIKDTERLKRLYMLFAMVLNKLHIMGSAYEDVPNVTLK